MKQTTCWYIKASIVILLLVFVAEAGSLFLRARAEELKPVPAPKGAIEAAQPGSVPAIEDLKAEIALLRAQVDALNAIQRFRELACAQSIQKAVAEVTKPKEEHGRSK